MKKVFAMQVFFVIAVFAIVIGATFPSRYQSIEYQKNNRYDDQVKNQLELAQLRYQKILGDPDHKLSDIWAARDNLVDCLWESQRFEEASKLLTQQMAETWPLKQNQYNEAWAETSRKLGDVHRDAFQIEAAIVVYQSVLDHGKQYLKADDPLLARDLNNLAMALYMRGSSFEEKEKRNQEFAKAESYLKQGLEILKKNNIEKSTKASSIYWNLYLVVRDQDKIEEAEGYRSTAQAIDKSMNRVCREP